jgi:hypothetical protein
VPGPCHLWEKLLAVPRLSLGPETVPTGPADAAVRCRCTSTLSLDIQTKCVHLVITIAVRVAEMEKGIESSEI